MDKSRLAHLCRLFFRQLPLGLAAGLLTIGVTINFINAIGRYGFDAAIFWAEEAMVYLAIWAIFLASIAVAYDRAELAMDFFSASRFADLTMTTITVFVCLFMATQSMTLLRTLIRNGQNSVALEVPMAIPQASLTFGFVMIAGAVIARFFLNSDPGSQTFEAGRVETTS